MQRSIFSISSALLLSLTLFACGGGGGGGGDDDDDDTSGLEGTWVYADGGHYSGTACGLDADGFEEYRYTLTFNGNNYTATFEECNLTSPIAGTFTTVGTASGTFVTGGIYATYNGYRLSKVDVITPSRTYYEGYNVIRNELRLTQDDATYDGSSDEKRERSLASEVYIKQ